MNCHNLKIAFPSRLPRLQRVQVAISLNGVHRGLNGGQRQDQG
jgi:hypothetical protein